MNLKRYLGKIQNKIKEVKPKQEPNVVEEVEHKVVEEIHASVKKTLNFVDPKKDPHEYLKRYLKEPKYKDWFNRNYPDYKIVNIDEELDGSNPKSLTTIQNCDNYRYIKGNITDYNLMTKLITNCDVIINFAAESHVDRSIYDARPFFDSNILGAFTILEILKKQKRRLIQISTDEVFGNLKTGTASEDSRLNPSSPYSSSKASAELLINSYIITYNVDALITRCSNNYGPRQFLEKLIPKTIILADQNHKIPIYNKGKGIRDWIYVDDHIEAILKVLHDGKCGESYNISSNEEFDVVTVVRKILSIMGKSQDNFEFAEDRPGHDDRYSMISSKIRKEFGWSPKIDFDKGLQMTVDWYLKNRDWWKDCDMNKLTHFQWT